MNAKVYSVFQLKVWMNQKMNLFYKHEYEIKIF